MSDEELGFMPATVLAPMIRQKKISPVEVVETVLRRIERLEPRVNAFAHLAGDRAMDLARKAEAALMSGRAVGPLHGLTVTIKDLSWTRDMPVQSGSRTMQGHRVAEDSPVVARLSVHLPAWEHQMDPHLVACIKEGAVVTMPTYQAMRARKYDYIAQIHHWFEAWDFLITPTVSVAAFPAERIIPEHWPQHPWDWMQWAEFSYPFNMSGNPAATVPCGFTAAGLPVGMQIVGKRFDDLGVFQASRAFEKALPWADKRPSL